MQHTFGRQKAIYGASLAELMVTLGIASILTSLAVPSLGRMVSQYRAATMANAMVSSLYRARGEAIHRNATVSVCKSSDGVKCSSTGGYERGWIVFHDVNGNAAIDANEAVIHVEQVPQSDVRLYGNNSVVNHISFTGLGVPKTTKGNFQAGTLTVCTPAFGEVAARLIVLSKPGNVRSAPSILTQCGPVPASEQ